MENEMNISEAIETAAQSQSAEDLELAALIAADEEERAAQEEQLVEEILESEEGIDSDLTADEIQELQDIEAAEVQADGSHPFATPLEITTDKDQAIAAADATLEENEIQDVATAKIATPLEAQIFGDFLTITGIVETVGEELLWKMAEAVATPLAIYLAEQSKSGKKEKKEHAGHANRAMNEDQVLEVRDLYGKPNPKTGRAWSYRELSNQLLLRDGVEVTGDAIRSCILRETYRNIS